VSITSRPDKPVVAVLGVVILGQMFDPRHEKLACIFAMNEAA
jgi:hypothetical protein